MFIALANSASKRLAVAPESTSAGMMIPGSLSNWTLTNGRLEASFGRRLKSNLKRVNSGRRRNVKYGCQQAIMRVHIREGSLQSRAATNDCVGA